MFQFFKILIFYPDLAFTVMLHGIALISIYQILKLKKLNLQFFTMELSNSLPYQLKLNMHLVKKFLDASSHLYMSVSVGRSVRRSVRRSLCNPFFLNAENEPFSL